MIALINSIHRFENNFERKVEHRDFNHPGLVLFALIFGLPVFTLLAVAMGTTLFVLPFSLIMGW
ncbi:MAG: hypothetical protein Q4B86_06525 [Eubacteriales bacterium]|nr:hypothetical protein [Eubacteriales bacterium]